MKHLNWLRDWPWLSAMLIMAGIGCADRHASAVLLGLAMPLALGVGLLPIWRGRLLVLLLFLLTAYVRAVTSFAPAPNLDAESWKDHRLEGAGWIIANPKRGENVLSFLFFLERVEGHPQVAPLPIFVQARPNKRLGDKGKPLPPAALGQRWKIQGRIDSLSGGFYPGDYDRGQDLGRHGVHQSLHVSWGLDSFEKLEEPRSLVLRLRLRLQQVFTGLLPTREAALLTGVVLGDPQQLDEPLQQAFQKTGTSHLLAASGANVALIVTLALAVGGLLGYGPKPLAIPCLVLGLIYVGLAGYAASILRAGWMSIFALGARALGRESSGGRCLALGVAAYLLVDPAALFDIGFQLSAAAVLSLILFQRPILRALPRLWLGEAIAAGLAVLYGLAPLFVFHFQELNLEGLVGNLLIAFPVEALLPVGLVQGLLGLFCTPLASAMSFLIRPWASACIAWVEYLAQHLQPAVLARPDLWCILAWLAAGTALLTPRRRVQGVVISLLCLALSQPVREGPWSRCRLVSRYGRMVLSWSTPGLPDILVLEDEKALGWAEGMLRKGGTRRVQPPLLVTGPGEVLEGGGLRFEQRPGSVEVQLHRFRLVWKTFAPLSAGDYGATVLVGSRLERARGDTPLFVRAPGPPKPGMPPHHTRILPGEFNLLDGPLEIRTDGFAVEARPWSDENWAEWLRQQLLRFTGDP